MLLLLAAVLLQTQDPPLTEVSKWKMEWFPDSVVYPYHLADPISPRSGSKITFPMRSRTSEHIKVEGVVGSARPMVRLINRESDEAIDFTIDAAIITRFDLNEGFDLDAGDYIYGFPIGYRLGRFASRFRINHLTSHLGDEFISREGARAIRYHRDEVALSFAYDWTPELRTYAEAGWGAYIGTPNERWKFNVGAEWIGELLWKGPPRVFLATDIKWREDTDYDTAIALQGGVFMMQGADRHRMSMRFLLELYYGHAAQTQFPEERNFYWAFGFAAGF